MTLIDKTTTAEETIEHIEKTTFEMYRLLSHTFLILVRFQSVRWARSIKRPSRLYSTIFRAESVSQSKGAILFYGQTG
jgi:hypothetical protein